ncbi:hypothetical protein HMPREF0063_10268 [Aeromicrobium marinum DSM 15272]|uniref:Membrane transport protein MMPL domain-containing protein n=2 Tax=Aeromicrobium marinum TaxID=219314 RepID=E2S8B1_9ACTN|nr:hypothetical protein HMPREF0063_10268 [Aeromicrobium marinum DSM 15272]
MMLELGSVMTGQVGPVITAAGLVFASTFVALLFSPVEALAQTGFRRRSRTPARHLHRLHPGRARLRGPVRGPQLVATPQAPRVNRQPREIPYE